LTALEHDPRRRPRRIALGAGAAAVLAGAWVLAGQVAATEDACAQVDRAMKEAWGPAQREALERAFRDEGKTYAEQSLARVEQVLDRHAAAWVEQRRATCEAGRAVGTEAGREAGLQAACLEQQLRRFDALVRLLMDADQALVARAISAVQGLSPPSRCADAEAYRRATPMPQEPERQRQVEALRLRMAEIHAQAMAGRLEEAQPRAAALLAEAREVGFEPLIAEVLLAVGGIAAQQGRFPPALSALEEGVLLARAHGLERLEADLLSPLVFVHTTYTSNFELADWQARVLEVLVDRVDPRPEQRARVLLDRGRLEHRRGRIAASIELLERAAALHQQGTSADGGSQLVLIYDHLASAYMEEDRVDDAARVLAQAEEVAATALGAEHPHRGNLLVHAGRVESARGNHARAAELLEGGLRIFEGAYGELHPNISAVLNGLALQLEDLGRPEEAVDRFRRAERLVLQTLGEEHEQVAIIRANLGNTLRRLGRADEALLLHRSVKAARERTEVEAEKRYEILDNIGDDLRVLGRCDEAVPQYEAANRLREEVGEAEGAAVAYALLGIGLCRWQTGGAARARSQLEAALERIEEAKDRDEPWPTELLALVRLSLAQVLRELDPGSARAAALAEQARAYWAGDPVQHRRLLEQVTAWQRGEPARMLNY
ncbi:MAG: tetratricopeptide repeat protein, partial [Myxococcales bacterium]|nr:tetratricopeptide repeat protein [Myxococcales bacterium]